MRRHVKAKAKAKVKPKATTLQLVAILSCTGKLIIFMWQRCPNMFPHSPPFLLLTYIVSCLQQPLSTAEQSQRSVLGE